MITILNDDLKSLRAMFNVAGFDIRFVGGCVRDLQKGLVPHDIDLCTDATPDEQIEIYKANNIRYVETGLQHGTVTVVINDVTYEITSLRTDVETDGRHAVVAYTRDWIEDLSRRDFTFNAMSLDFDGNLLDPFNGVDDLNNGIVRFVGDARTRIEEDYLRILRWVRFRGRFADLSVSTDLQTVQDIMACAHGLKKISRERIWMELQKILMDKKIFQLVAEMEELKIIDGCGLPPASVGFWASYNEITERRPRIKNPVTMLCLLYRANSDIIIKGFKGSVDEINLAKFVCENVYVNNSFDPKYALAVKQARIDWVKEVAAVAGMDKFKLAMLEGWTVPEFPVTGYDLIQLGMKPGPEYGKIIGALKDMWAESNYTADKATLLAYVSNRL